MSKKNIGLLLNYREPEFLYKCVPSGEAGAGMGHIHFSFQFYFWLQPPQFPHYKKDFLYDYTPLNNDVLTSYSDKP